MGESKELLPFFTEKENNDNNLVFSDTEVDLMRSDKNVPAAFTAFWAPLAGL